MDGYLRGHRDQVGGCVWVEEAASGAAAPVVWPPGFVVRFDPLELLGPDGEVLAREGDMLGFGGGFVEYEDRSACGLGQERRWVADDVGVVDN